MKAWGRRVFSLFVRIYPRDFREQYEDAMTDHFHTEDNGLAGAMRTCADVFWTSIVMRFEHLRRDLGYAVRMNAKAPLFTGVIVITIALAIASNTVVFALLNAVLLKPLPFANASRLGIVWESMQRGNGQTFTALGNKDANAVASASRTFSGLTYAMPPETVSVPGGATLRRVEAQTNYFAVLGVHPLLGTFITKGPPAHQAVISWNLWHARYAGDPHVLGEQIKLEGTAYTIVGVAPAGMRDPTFGALQRNDAWTNLPALPGGSQVVVFPVARLRPGVTWQAAQADLARVQRNVKGLMMPGSALMTGPLPIQSSRSHVRSCGLSLPP